MNRELQVILEPYDNWQNDVDYKTNQEAKAALHKFYKKLLKHKPATKYEKGDISHYRYLHFFVEINKAFQEQKYLRVCNELFSMMHYVPFFQKRIYNNTIRILATFLQIEGDDRLNVQKSLEKGVF